MERCTGVAGGWAVTVFSIVPPRKIPSSALVALLVVACHQAPHRNQIVLASPTAPASLLRLPRSGGNAVLYHLPDLKPAGWQSREELPELTGVLGANLDQQTVYAQSKRHQIVSLELDNGRTATVLDGVRSAVTGPDGVLYAVRDSNTVTMVRHRTPVRLRGRLPAAPDALYGTLSDDLIAAIGGKSPRLVILTTDDSATTVAVPAGTTAATYWGDLVAIAADSALVLYSPSGTSPFLSVDAGNHVRGVSFSPSGHRIYVARESHDVGVIDRFTRRALHSIDLPGSPVDFRLDPAGRWLLARPAGIDSVYVVDLSIGEYLDSWETRWTGDLPAVAGDGTLLLAQGKNLIAHDLTADAWPETGRLQGGADDLWLGLAWTPEGGTRPVPAQDTTLASADTTEARVYLQVSSSQNSAWAEDLANKLRQAGLPSSVLDPRQEGDGYRVVLGPYASRDEAEAAGKKLGRPFFIYQPSTQ